MGSVGKGGVAVVCVEINSNSRGRAEVNFQATAYYHNHWLNISALLQ
jgi:hypothetical protein